MRVRAGRLGIEREKRTSTLRAISVFLVVLLVGIAPLYNAALTTADGWTIDASTGVEYREVTGEELNRTPWPDDNVYVFRKYGALADFETDDQVTIPMVANGSVFVVDFYYNHSVNLTVHEQAMLPKNTTLDGPADEPLNWSATVQVRHYHGKGPDGNWTWWGGRAFNPADGFYAVGQGPDNQRVLVLENQTNFNLNDDVERTDFLSVIDPECETSGGEDGGGSNANFQTATSNGSGCPPPALPLAHGYPLHPCDRPGAYCRPGEANVYYAGENVWCERRGQRNWVVAVHNLLDRNQHAFQEFENQDDESVMSYAGATCWFQAADTVTGWDMSDSGGFQHNIDYCHQHAVSGCDDGVQEDHDYPYNRVTEDGSLFEYQEHDFDEYLAGAPNDWDHLLAHYPTWPQQSDPENFQIVHQTLGINNAGGDIAGMGDRPGFKSIAAPPAQSADFTAAHELGHNYNGLHRKATCFGSQVTVMGEGDKAVNECGASSDSWDRVARFSGDGDDGLNQERIGDCLVYPDARRENC